MMSDQPAAPEIIEDDIVDTGTEEFAHVVAMLVLLEPGMSYTHSVALSPDYGAGQIVQDVNSLKKRARRLLVPAMHAAAKRSGQVYNVESSLVLYPSGRLFAQAIVTRSR